MPTAAPKASEKRYSLWRGDVRLGWFPEQSVPSGKKLVAGAVGYLRLADPSVEIVGVMQTRFGALPPLVPEMIFQDPQAPDDRTRERSQARGAQQGREGRRVLAKDVAVAALNSEPPPVIPPEQVLRIGMPDGSMLTPHMLQIQQFIVPAEQEATARHQAGIETGPMWIVFFGHHDTSEEQAEVAKLQRPM
jgi:hypothetical protein